MDFDHLSNKEVNELINRLKHPKNKISFQEAYQQIMKLFGKVDINEAIIDDDDIEYVLRVYRGKIDITRFSIHIRFKEYHHHLIRVDINPTNKHINPDDEIIVGSHIHIYDDRFDKKDQLAIPIEQSDFPNVDTLIDAFEEFIKYTHIEY